MNIRSRISGTGLGVPSKVITNADLEKMVDTSDEWISTRTGIKERRVVDREKGETNASLSIAACLEALHKAELNAKDIDLIVCCTATPDTMMPITAARVVHGLGAVNAASFDLNSACTGFVAGLNVVDNLIRAGAYKKVLLVGADIFSSIIDWTDRKTCVLFGDGAGAAVVEAVEVKNESTESFIIGSKLYTDFDVNESLAVKSGGSRHPETRGFVNMNGQEVFKAGSRGMVRAASDILSRFDLSLDQVRWFIPHQANRRIVEMVAKLLNFPSERVYMNLDVWGNTSAGTIPICLGEMNRKGLLKKGDLLLLDAFGGGYTYGAALLRW